jgi:low temperature requirement protein LtrA
MRNESKILVAKTDIKRNNSEDLNVDGRIILKFILNLCLWKMFYVQEERDHEKSSDSKFVCSSLWYLYYHIYIYIYICKCVIINLIYTPERLLHFCN